MCARGIAFASFYDLSIGFGYKLEKKYAPALDNYGQSCFVRSDLSFFILQYIKLLRCKMLDQIMLSMWQ
jgi:hypothetical protein